MIRYLAEPRNILAEPLGSSEPRLKNTGVDYVSSAIDLSWSMELKKLY
jgi:hypothetical protein